MWGTTGPILFLLYINDLPNSLKTSKPTLFADDTNLTCEGNLTCENKLNEELRNVHQWLTANKLTLNEEKTEFMLIGSRSRGWLNGVGGWVVRRGSCVVGRASWSCVVRRASWVVRRGYGVGRRIDNENIF
jgi:hypothetical protein